MYELNTVRHGYDESDIGKYKKYGFKFDRMLAPSYISTSLIHKYYINDIFKIFIEINNNDELQNLLKDFDKIIMTKDCITIYDDFNE